jgi:type I restriction enzyme M protein
MGSHGIRKIYGQEKNITIYNLARMNMLHHGDTLTNDWDFLRETNPAKMPKFDAIVANPPFSYRWESKKYMGDFNQIHLRANWHYLQEKKYDMNPNAANHQQC